LAIFNLISFHTPEKFVPPAKKWFAVITKLQLAGNFDGRSVHLKRSRMREKTGAVPFIQK
jgi:hypothetical protein